MSTIEYEVTGRIARLTLDRPQRGNGITRELLTELERHVEQADLDPEVHVLLLAGNGKGFCGGYDLVQTAEGERDAPSAGAERDASSAGSEQDASSAVRRPDRRSIRP